MVRRHGVLTVLVFVVVLGSVLGLSGTMLARGDEGGYSDGAAEVVGQTEEGALFRLAVPENWNGELVVFMHGYVRDDQPIALPAGAVPRIALERGYGIALSSFSETGWAVKEGARESHALVEMFAEHFGPPARTYAVGVSMGGLIAVMLGEKFPHRGDGEALGRFDGVLSICGILGGADMNFEYLQNARLLFDYYFPGVIPEDAGLADRAAMITAVTNAVRGDLPRAREFAQVDQIELAFTNSAQLETSIVTAVIGQISTREDLADRLHGKNAFDNWDIVYSGSSDDAALNAAVPRFTADPLGVKYLEKYYEPTGELEVPVLTVHDPLDHTAPIRHEESFAEAAAREGASDLLAQRTTTRYGHCTSAIVNGGAEVGPLLDTLATWVRTGVRPG